MLEIVSNQYIKKIQCKFMHILSSIYIKYLTKGVIYSGPFKDMKYHASKYVSYTTKLLGTYELEVCNVIEIICKLNLNFIINIGAAEGYYVIGLLLKNNKANAIAFEMNNNLIDIIKLNANLNNVNDRLLILRECTRDNLKICIKEKSFLIVDVEGAEVELLDPEYNLILQSCYILLEVHDFVNHNISCIIKKRFMNTHTIKEYESRDRNKEDYPINNGKLNFIDKLILKYSMDEGRPGKMKWFFMEPKLKNE